MKKQLITHLVGFCWLVCFKGTQHFSSALNRCDDPMLCPDHATCTNAPQGYYCTCRPGFISTSGATEFTDPSVRCNADRCVDSSLCPAYATCDNVPGSYHCTCKRGFAASSGEQHFTDGTVKCNDIDECLDVASCPANATCTNTPGNHYCTCNTGFASSSGEQRFTDPAAQCHEVASNDLVRNCENRRLDAAHGLSPDDAFPSASAPSFRPAQAAFCTLLTSTFSVLGDPYERKNSTVSLEKAAEGFASILEQTPFWSNLSTEQLSTMATVFLERLGNVVLDAFDNPTGNGSQTIQMEQLDVQTKVIEDGCPEKDSVVSLEVKGETMKISCRTIQGTVAQGTSPPPEGVRRISQACFSAAPFGVGMGSPICLSSALLDSLTRSPGIMVFPTCIILRFFLIIIIIFFLQPSSSPDELICVSWEATARRGSWSRAGCGVLPSNATHTTCSCNRISNLAVLMASGEITAGFPLFLISHVGLALSLLCLFLAILTFLLCRSIRNVNTSIHLQLCLCLFLADLLFLTAVDSPSHQLACAVIAGLLHYLFLACFAWMFLEAVVLFLTVRNLGVVNYFSTHSPKMRHLRLFGYGFPALVVAVSAAVMPAGYGRQEK
ncbi:branched-chain amino acid aminotransferase [Platysternon megacephalum]|uniref:Branched-chain amino acid aminotransferase n=1 Tax=Platysternon megacephalum TaxID=55544 RepID=A0A4D9DEK6_9SAUR|nr:branched-chain amino acid aminotransferase [Platysternon megacephalum]